MVPVLGKHLHKELLLAWGYVTCTATVFGLFTLHTFPLKLAASSSRFVWASELYNGHSRTLLHVQEDSRGKPVHCVHMCVGAAEPMCRQRVGTVLLVVCASLASTIIVST